jgi:tetratricopeptide (TPR) repeat protein
VRTLIGLLGIAALAVLAALSIQRGAADLYAFGARHALDRGGLAGPQPGLEKAVQLDGGNAEPHEYMARLHESRGEYREALERYRIAAKARPGSPGAWGDIARLKLRLAEFDGELDKAIRSASRLGPWEPDLQLVIADVAMQGEPRLTPEARRAAFAMMSRALKRQEREVVQLAVQRGRLDVLCSIPGIGAYPRAARRCI